MDLVIERPALIRGDVLVQLFDQYGRLKAEQEIHNLITAVGDQMYAARGAGIAGPPAAPTGMRLGTGTTAVAKSGTGSALVSRLTDGNQAFDSGYPQASGGVVTYKVTYATGKATSGSAITEAVIVNDNITADTSTAAGNTIARVLLTGIGSKGALDTLTVTWTHTLLGA
jgi:hypothetical protein